MFISIAIGREGGVPPLIALTRSEAEFTLSGGRHAIHHASLMQNGGEARVLRSAAAAANMPREARIFAKIILRNLEHHLAESSI
ncbi:hypothetical protein F2Q69_00002266 [Brassica cretica]|uniref:Uncharacterized protein n=1 Tax=Brassica cretica TaxID=69181 RepID=A0A8S9P2U7_BRACR|nr:hypothetical protein F2Q69_00002266 [Brassica cretica]